jgi:ferredoxin
VTAFIKDMRFVGGKHCFVFSTHGTLPSNFFARIIPELNQRGLIVIGYGDWYASADAAHGYGHHLTDGHPDEIDLQEAEAFGREMVTRSARISAGETNLIPEVPTVDPRFVPTPEFMKHAHLFPKVVKYEKEKCLYPACRLCMDNCPTDGIDLTVDPPVIANPCMGCQGFCEAICPTGAIVDTSRTTLELDHRRMEELGHPDMAAVLREAEAEGRFRRLVTEEEAEERARRRKLIDKHPRWIIGKGRP